MSETLDGSGGGAQSGYVGDSFFFAGRETELADLDAAANGWDEESAEETHPWRACLEHAIDSHAARAVVVRFGFVRHGFARPLFLSDVWPLMTAFPTPDHGVALRRAFCDWLTNRTAAEAARRPGSRWYRDYVPDCDAAHGARFESGGLPTIAPALGWLAGRLEREAATLPRGPRHEILRSVAELMGASGLKGGAAALPWRVLAAAAAAATDEMVGGLLSEATLLGAHSANVFVRDAAAEVLAALYVHVPAAATATAARLAAGFVWSEDWVELRFWRAVGRRLPAELRDGWRTMFDTALTGENDE